MKLLAQLVFVAVIAWFAHSIGFKSGLESSDGYVKLRRDELLARETSFLEISRRASEYSVPTKEECIPALAGFDDDIYGFCSDFFARDQRDYNASRDHDRSQYE